MKVVFLQDVEGVAQGGDVKQVKNGFARNYLIPQKLAMPATRDALRRVDRLAGQADEQRLKTLADMKALAEQIDGTQVNIEMRAGASGRLYGSVTNAIVAAELSKLTEREIDRRTISIPEAIRQVGKYGVPLRLHADVDASITLLVHPTGTEPGEFLEKLASQEEGEAREPESAAEAAVEQQAGEESPAEAAVEQQAAEESPAEAAVEQQAAEESPAEAAAEQQAAEESPADSGDDAEEKK